MSFLAGDRLGEYSELRLREISTASCGRVIGKMIGYYKPSGGFVRPEACIEAQLDLAKQAGAESELGTIVKQLHQELAGVRVETDRGD